MPSDMRNKIGAGLFAAAAAFLGVAIAVALWTGEKSPADRQVSSEQRRN